MPVNTRNLILISLKNSPALRTSENLKVLVCSAQLGLNLRILRMFFELFINAQIYIFFKLI